MNTSTGYDTVSYHEPLGVFVGIAPFNFPAMIPMGWMVPLAITTGNTYVLKAASLVPQTAMRMVDLLMEAGLPKGVLNLVTASRNESEPLLRHPMVKGVTLVGTKKVGMHVFRTAAEEGKRVQSLTEAKNHALILRDAPIMATAARVMNSAFGCAGERCMALPALCVEEAIADELVDAVTGLCKKTRLGAAWLEDTEPRSPGDRHASRIGAWLGGQRCVRGCGSGPRWPQSRSSRLRRWLFHGAHHL